MARPWTGWSRSATSSTGGETSGDAPHRKQARRHRRHERRGKPRKRAARKKAAAMNPIYNFEGQVALVTGASSGIGLAAAQAFAQAGASVVLADVNERALKAATGELASAGHLAWPPPATYQTKRRSP